MSEHATRRERVRATAIGVLAAWRAPAVIHSGLPPLLESNVARPRAALPATAQALRVGQSTLRWLARLPGGRWRTTCLYRSIVDCLILRALGETVHLTIAAGHAGAARVPSTVIAHAWVEDARGLVRGSAHRDTRLRRFTATARQRQR